DTAKAKTYREHVEKTEDFAKRAVNLAMDGVPPEGAGTLLERDPLTMGANLFRQNCAVCHTYGDSFKNEEPTAWDLEDYGTKQWIGDLLRNPDGPRFTSRPKLKPGGGGGAAPEGARGASRTKFKTMLGWVTRTRRTAQRKGE